MKQRYTLLCATLLLIVMMLGGCTKGADVREIKDIPVSADEIMTSELMGQSGSYTKGSIYVSGTGYIIFDVQIQSGSLKSIGLKDATDDEVIYTISKPNNALYDSGYYEYQESHEYKLDFDDAKDLEGTVTVYFVAE